MRRGATRADPRSSSHATRRAVRAHLVLLLSLACAKAAAPPAECVATPTAQGLKRASNGLLPSGRGIAPMGETVQVGQSPQNIAVSPDGRTLAVAEFGVQRRGLSVVSLPELQLAAQPVQDRSGGYSRGLAFDKDGTLHALNTGAKRIEVWDPSFTQHRDIAVQGDWPVDLALSADGARLYGTAALTARLEMYDAHSGA